MPAARTRGSRARVLSGVAALLCIVPFAGCTSRTTMVGPRPPATYTAERRAEGRACGFLVLGVIPSSNFQRRTEIAYQRALQNGGKALTDTSIQHSWYTIPFAGFLLCTRLEGKVVD